MDELEIILYHYRRLLSLLQQDYDSIRFVFQGDYADEYEEIILREINVLQDHIQDILKLQET